MSRRQAAYTKRNGLIAHGSRSDAISWGSLSRLAISDARPDVCVAQSSWLMAHGSWLMAHG